MSLNDQYQQPRNEFSIQEAIYRTIYRQHYGNGPYECKYCSTEMQTLEVVHHIDENHWNHALENLAGVHKACHTIIHRTGQTHTEETRQQISENKRNKPLTEAQRNHMCRPRSKETKEKISKAQTDRTLSEETKAKLRAKRGKCECGLETNTGNVSRHCQRTGHKRVS